MARANGEGKETNPFSRDAGRRHLKLAFIGAGGINFGDPSGPWNHAGKIERDPDVSFTAIVDPYAELAQKRLDDKLAGEHKAKWANAKIYKDVDELLAAGNLPDAVIIGVPPHVHGSIDDPKANLELKLAKAGISQFIEKPVSVKKVEEVSRLAEELRKIQAENGVILAVGYMLRYSPAVQVARKIIAEHDAIPISLLGRYAAAYTHIYKTFFWDVEASGGPIVEMATHMVDLMRYMAGDVVKESIHAHAIHPDQLILSDMAKAPQAEHGVPEERRCNRATTAIFEFENGITLGTLSHSILLHERDFHTQLEIICDGLHVIIEDPYGTKVSVQYRLPHSNEYHVADLDRELDMYDAQFRDFLHAVRTGDDSGIRSLYKDAVKTYETTKWIADASAAKEASRAAKAAPAKATA